MHIPCRKERIRFERLRIIQQQAGRRSCRMELPVLTQFYRYGREVSAVETNLGIRFLEV